MENSGSITNVLVQIPEHEPSLAKFRFGTAENGLFEVEISLIIILAILRTDLLRAGD